MFTFCEVCIRILAYMFSCWRLPPLFDVPVVGRMRHMWLRNAALLAKALPPPFGIGIVGTSWAFIAFLTLVAELPFLLPAGFAVFTSWPWAGPCWITPSLPHGPVQAISVLCAWPWAGLTVFCASGPVQASLRGSQVLSRPGGTWILALSRPYCCELSWPCAGPWRTLWSRSGPALRIR